MEGYRPLGRTGVAVSPICLGCWQFGDRASPEESAAMIDAALEAGINFLDTSNIYGGGIGRSESIIGDALAEGRRRDRVVIATKAYFPTDPDDPNARGVSRRHLIAACEASLRRLRTDYIDVYYLHRPDPGVPVDETLRALDDLIRAGKVRYTGTSMSSAWRFVEALWIAKELGLHRYVAETPPYNLLDRRIERELVPMAQRFGVALSPWAPLAGGLLTGTYKRGQPPPPGSRYAHQAFAAHYGHRLHDGVFDVLDVLEAIAEETSCTLAQLALAWVLRQPGITSPILGVERMHDLSEGLAALEVAVDEEHCRRIDAVISSGEWLSRFYEEAASGATYVAPAFRTGEPAR